ncbi:MAG: FtsX-like permease family protein [Oscillospiraceae bacterium]|nr:FtsX-like permease family protein [Oscillospiraceae bacterium]
MEIIRLLKANIRHKKGAFKSIAALMAIIVLSFTGTISNNDNIDRTIKEGQIWSDVPDMTVFMEMNGFDDETVSAINNNPDVAGLEAVNCVMSRNSFISGQETYQATYIYPESYDVYRVFNESMTGYIEDPELLKEGEIYIAYSLRGLYDNVEIGSEVRFEIPSAADPMVNDTYSLKVKGFIADPNFGAAIIGTKRYFVSEADFEKMYGAVHKSRSVVEAGISFNDGADYLQVKKALNESCNITEKSMLIISEKETGDYTKLYSDTGSGIVVAFVILLIVIAIITMYHSITTSIEMEYINLGILKAQGFTSWKIRLVYILQYVAAEIIGAVVGLILSVPVLFMLGTLFQSITGLATVHRISLLKCVILSLGVIAVCVVFVITATLKVTKISPVRAISGGKSEVHFDSRINVPVKAKPLAFFMGLRQFTSRAKSYIGIILIAGLLIYFLMSIIVLSDRLSGGKFMSGMIYPNITVITSDEFRITDMEKFEKTVCEIDGEAKVMFNSTEYMLMDDVELFCDAATPVELMYQPLEGRMPVYDNEVAITEIVADELGKKIGDTVMVGGENAKEFLITGYYQSLSELGRTFTMTAEGRYRVTGKISNCYIEVSDLNLIDKISEALDEKHSSLIGAKTLQRERDSSADGMIQMIDGICAVLVIVVFGISIAFSAVVINMVCAKAFTKERVDTGILKSLGFTSQELRLQFSFRFMIISAVGALAGGIASVLFTKPLLGLLLRIVGLTRIESSITPATFIVPSAAICASFFIFAYIAARKINTVEVRELISD